MNLKRAWYLVTIITLLGIIFYFGYLFGNRSFVNNEPDNIKITAPNGSIKNSLSEMVIKDIYGLPVSSNVKTYGTFYYKTVEEEGGQVTEILIKMKGVPIEIVNPKTKARKQTPRVLNILIAEKTPDELDYIYTKIGQLSFGQPVDNYMSAEFSTTLDFALVEYDNLVDRIVFESPEPDSEFFLSYPDVNLPLNVRNGPAPYFWVKLR